MSGQTIAYVLPHVSDAVWQTNLGWGPDFDKAAEPYRKKGLEPARVILVYRKQLKVLSHRGEHWARTGGSLMHHAESVEDFPAVGDWVVGRIPAEGEALIHAVLPRRTAFVRKVPGTNTAPQVLAANVDTVLVVMGLDNDFNVRRLERYLTLAWESRARPIVVLNKSDVAIDLELELSEVRAIAGDAPVHVVSALRNEGLEPLREATGAGKTVVLLGSSGVGKSTLVNCIVGQNVMTTGGLRDDGKGRHTTTRRELLLLPTGGSIIDTPGLREVQLWAAKDGLNRTFDDIELLATKCRFRDCHHDAEPGCAVKAALEDGTLDDLRYDSWLELQQELTRLAQPADVRGRPTSKRRERVGHGVRRK